MKKIQCLFTRSRFLYGKLTYACVDDPSADIALPSKARIAGGRLFNAEVSSACAADGSVVGGVVLAASAPVPNTTEKGGENT
jgi:hypothetical protein